jgi:hypothetical protein
MTGARSILDRTGGAIQIRQEVEAIEGAIHDQPAFVFDLAKALVETICKTILKDLGVDHDNNFDAPELLKETMTQLCLSPSGHESHSNVTKSIKKTVNGLMATVYGLCELRNREGMASHGREAFSSNLEPMHAILAASAADAVSSFLWNVHKSYSPTEQPERLSYGDNPVFDEWVDQNHEPPVTIFELPFQHSEILFRLDIQAYSEMLNDFIATPEQDEGREGTPAVEGTIEKTDEREEQS